MRNQLLHKNVEQAAAACPDQEAVRCGNHSLSYAELNDRSSRFAAALIDMGVRPGDRVGISLPPGIESPVSVYGVLKAGAVFVAIDPHSPVQRTCEVLRAAEIRHLVTNRLSAESFEHLRNNSPLKHVIGENSFDVSILNAVTWDSIESYSTMIPVTNIQSDAPAYIIFTSGSTGSPKGIVHTHFSGQSYARLSAKTYNVVAEDRIANASPLHFDMSTFGYFTAPFARATTVFVPDAYLKMPASLSQLLQAERISIWYSVPFLLIQLLERGVLDQRDLSDLRWVLFGGEPFSQKHVRQLMDILPKARFSNVYGPAEVNQCTFFHVPRERDSAVNSDDAVPIGSEWDETEAIIDESRFTDESNNTGELLIHSTTMMQRYLNASSDDTETFHITEDGKRFYRTGDLVRRNVDGTMTFVGRKDRQVKVRGYRIELDEIEHVLTCHPDVIEAAVFSGTAADQESDVSIRAAVRVSSPEVNEDRLRNWLTKKLPSYAIPETIDTCDSFPRTTSGKVNRRQLQTNPSNIESLSGRT